MKSTNRRSLKHERLFEAFISLIDSKSASLACRLSNENIASFLDCNKDTVQSLLAEAEQKGILKAEYRTVILNDRPNTIRTIYFVSKVNEETGSLQLGTIMRAHGQTFEDSPSMRRLLCGRLRCTPEQLTHWLRVLCAKGYYTKTERDGKFYWKRIGTFQIIAPQAQNIITKDNGDFELSKPESKPVYFAKMETVEASLENWLAMNGGKTSASYEVIGKDLQASKPAITKAAKALEAAGKLIRKKVGRGVELSLTNTEKVRPAVDDLAAALVRLETKAVDTYTTNEVVSDEAPATKTKRAPRATAIIRLANYKIRKTNPMAIYGVGYDQEDAVKAQLAFDVENGWTPVEAAHRVLADLVTTRT